MTDEKRVKDIMIPIEEYDTIGINHALCDALTILKRNYEGEKVDATGKTHKTLFVKDDSGKIVGKINMFDLIRGLVPEAVKKPELSRAFYSVFSSRALEVADEVGDIQTHFKWMHSTFFDLVKQEAHKKVNEIMSPVHMALGENDTINNAIFIMFKENIHQPLVVKEGKIIGVVDLMVVFSELLAIVGPECFVNWE